MAPLIWCFAKYFLAEIVALMSTTHVHLVNIQQENILIYLILF